MHLVSNLFGDRQHGIPAFRFFDPLRDEALLARARSDARAVIEGDPELAAAENERFRALLTARYGERERLYEVG